jgi:hypothetical protein
VKSLSNTVDVVLSHLAVCILVAGVLAPTAFGGDIYVKMFTGSDSTGTGELLNPFKTISFALTQASADDVVRVKGGTSSVDNYSVLNGEEFPLEPGTGVSCPAPKLEHVRKAAILRAGRRGAARPRRACR